MTEPLLKAAAAHTSGGRSVDELTVLIMSAACTGLGNKLRVEGLCQRPLLQFTTHVTVMISTTRLHNIELCSIALVLRIITWNVVVECLDGTSESACCNIFVQSQQR